MQITSIMLKNYKKFQKKALSFKPGINIVIGENEQGKSTVLNAIITALYTDPSTRSKTIIDSIKSWQGGSPLELTLDIDQEGKKFQIVKNFDTRTNTLTNLESNKKLEDIKQIEVAITKLTKIPTEAIYRSTALIRQKEIAQVDSGADLKKAVQDALSGSGDTDIESVKKQIAAEMGNLNLGLNRPAKNAGRIKQAQDRLESLKSEYEDAKTEWEKLIKASQTEKESGADLGKLDREINIIEELLENQKKYESSEKELKQVQIQIRDIERILQKTEGLRQRYKEIDEKMKKLGNVSIDKFEEDIGRAGSIASQINTKEEMLEKVQGSGTKMSSSKRSISSFGNIIWWLLIIVGGLMAFVFNTLFIVLVVIGLISILYSIFLRKPSSNGRQEYFAQIENLQKEIAEEEAILSQILQKYGAENLNSLQMKKLRYRALEADKQNIDSEIRGILMGKKIKELEKNQLELMTRKKEIEQVELTDEVRKSNMSPQEYLSKRRELDSLKIKKRTIERKQVESEVRIDDADITYDTLVQFEEEIERYTKILEESQFDLKVLNTISEALDQAGADLSGQLESAVVQTVQKDLPLVTNARYKDIRIGKDFGLEVFSPEKDDWVDPLASLSAGTIDQIYFLYRLALLKTVEQGSKVPLLLDDPFVTFDSRRLEETRKILEKETSESGRQILLFTHDNDFKSWGNVIEV